MKYLHRNLFSQLWVWYCCISGLWMIAALSWCNVNRTNQPGFLLSGNTNHLTSQLLPSSGWDGGCILICCDCIKDDNTAKAEGDRHIGRLNSVRAFFVSLGQATTGAISDFSLEPLSTCALRMAEESREGSLLCDTWWTPNLLQSKETTGLLGMGELLKLGDVWSKGLRRTIWSLGSSSPPQLNLSKEVFWI